MWALQLTPPPIPRAGWLLAVLLFAAGALGWLQQELELGPMDTWVLKLQNAILAYPKGDRWNP